MLSIPTIEAHYLQAKHTSRTMYSPSASADNFFRLIQFTGIVVFDQLDVTALFVYIYYDKSRTFSAQTTHMVSVLW